MSRIIGIEIGNETIKLAVCANGTVRRLITENLPDNMVREGRIVIPDAMSEFLAELRKKYHLGFAEVSIVLPDSLAYVKRFSIAAMNDSEIRLNLPYEFKDYLDQEKVKEDYVYDYAILSVNYESEEEDPKAKKESGKKDNKDNKGTDANGKNSKDESDGKDKEKEKKAEPVPTDYTIFAAAVKQSVIDEYVSIFKKAGFRLRRAMTYEMALQGILDNAKDVPADLCIVDVGASNTGVNIFHDGKFSMGKNIDAGGAYFDEKIAAYSKVDAHTAKSYKETNKDGVQSIDMVIDTYNYMSIEAMKIVNFYRYTAQSEGYKSTINDIYFAGGSSIIENLRTRIMKSTELQQHDISKLINVSDADAPLANICFAAIGAGIAK